MADGSTSLRNTPTGASYYVLNTAGNGLPDAAASVSYASDNNRLVVPKLSIFPEGVVLIKSKYQ